MDLATRYTDQMIRALARFDGVDDFVQVPEPKSSAKRLVRKLIDFHYNPKGVELLRRVKFDRDLRLRGGDWPVHADTMIGVKRLENIRYCIKTVIEDGIEGDLIETGVWRGGGAIMMKACLEAYGDTKRTLWCADSFEGLPPPDLDRYPQDIGMIWHTQSELAVSLEAVKSNFAKYTLLDERVKFLKGWFKDTLPTAPIKALAVLRMDGDLYASTIDVFHALYSKVTKGGFIIVDDYNIPEDVCRRAVEDFRKANAITDQIIPIDKFGVYWQKT
jgi:O-methyltransferase